MLALLTPFYLVTIYALALARRTALPLKFFKCGWFDSKNYLGLRHWLRSNR